MKSYTTQYSLLFYLSWLFLYIVFPVWRRPDYDRPLIFLGLITYFSIAAFLMNRLFRIITIDKPIISWTEDWKKLGKDNLPLCIVCCIAIAFQVQYIFWPITYIGEGLHLNQTFFLYSFITKYWHKFFDFPIQYAFWSFTILIIILIKHKKNLNFKFTALNTKLSESKVKISATLFFIFLILSLLFIYFRFLPHYDDMSQTWNLIRYPPVSRVLYVTSYFFLGMNHIAPRIVNVIFYLLSAVYLYRTIILFRTKETALLGTSIFLFSPLIFSYAHLGMLASGKMFFIITSSFYFLRFLKNYNNRDLILTSCFIGIGFLYKQDIFLIFFMCFSCLVIDKIKNRDLDLKMHLGVIMLSLFPIIPWFKLGSQTRGYEITWNHFTSFNKIAAYFSVIPSQISWILFSLFLLSIIFILVTKKDTLSLYFGLLFAGFYVFYTGDQMKTPIHRFSNVFYPTIAVYLAIFLSSIVQKVGWKHFFQVVFSVLTVYLIVLCTILPRSAGFITYKDYEAQHFPIDKTLKWIRDNVNDTEKVLSINMDRTAGYYIDKFKINKTKIIFYKSPDPTPHGMMMLSEKNNVSYMVFLHKIVFPYYPITPQDRYDDIYEYLRENRAEEFTEVARFSLGENYIFIYKLHKP